jgi:hypothetical protein
MAKKVKVPDGVQADYSAIDPSGRLFSDPERWTGWEQTTGSGETKLHVTQEKVVGKFLDGFPGKSGGGNGVPFKQPVELVFETPGPEVPTVPELPPWEPVKTPEILLVGSAYGLEDQSVYLGDKITLEYGNETLVDRVVITGLPSGARFGFDPDEALTIEEVPSGIAITGNHQDVMDFLRTLSVTPAPDFGDDFTLVVDRYSEDGTKILSGNLVVDMQPTPDSWIISDGPIDLTTNEWISVGKHLTWSSSDADGSEQVTSVDLTLSANSMELIRYEDSGATWAFFDVPGLEMISGVRISGTEEQIRSALDSLEVFYPDELSGSLGVMIETADSGQYSGSYYGALLIV